MFLARNDASWSFGFCTGFQIDLSKYSNSLGAHREPPDQHVWYVCLFWFADQFLGESRRLKHSGGGSMQQQLSSFRGNISMQYTHDRIYSTYIYIYTYIHIYIYIFIYSGIYIHIDIPCSHDVFLHLSFTWSKDTPQSQKDSPSSRSAAKPGRQAIVAGGVDLHVAWKLHAKRTLGMIGFGSFLVSINSKGITRVFFVFFLGGGRGGDEFLTFSDNRDNHDGQHVYFVLEPEAV